MTTERSGTSPTRGASADRPVRRRWRGQATSCGLLALGGLIGMILALQAWWLSNAEPPVNFTGNESTGSLAGVLAGAVLAGTALALLLRRRGRRIVAVPLALIGVSMIMVGAFPVEPDPTRFPNKPLIVLGAEAATLWVTPVPGGYAVCGVLVLLGALAMLVWAGRWREPSDRYTRTAVRAAGTTVSDDPAEVWKALDAGHDPTRHDPARAKAPDARNGADPEGTGRIGGSGGTNASDRRE